MWSWKSNVLKIFISFAVSIVLVAAERSPGFARDREPTGGSKEEDHSGATINIRVTLEGITSYRDYLELRTALLQSEGVNKVTLDTEAPSLITLSVRYAGEPKGLIESLTGFFSKKYRIKEKGGSEISISP